MSFAMARAVVCCGDVRAFNVAVAFNGGGGFTGGVVVVVVAVVAAPSDVGESDDIGVAGGGGGGVETTGATVDIWRCVLMTALGKSSARIDIDDTDW
jgi:hypothetical protein